MLKQVQHDVETTSEDWQSLPLHEQVVTINTRRYHLNQTEELLGVLKWIVERVVKG